VRTAYLPEAISHGADEKHLAIRREKIKGVFNEAVAVHAVKHKAHERENTERSQDLMSDMMSV